MKKIIFVLVFLLLLSTPVFAKSEPWILYDSFDIEANTTTPHEGLVLDSNYKYKIVVTGTYFAGDNIEADALCSYREGSSVEWTNSVSTYEQHGPELLDLMMNSDSNWGYECSPDHNYSFVVQGDGSQPSFYINDIYSVNNVGSLHVNVYRFEKTLKGNTANTCKSIQSGELIASDGSVISTGYDSWGYNYQASLFNGSYCDAYRDVAWCQPYKDDSLSMKWNDAWLSNKDCDGDGSLDRHYGFSSYIGSGAWLTNHQSGEYLDAEENVCKWNYFVKIVAAPSDAVSVGGVWHSADGIEIGSVIWGQFAIVQEVNNDSCASMHGLDYLSPLTPGFGFY